MTWWTLVQGYWAFTGLLMLSTMWTRWMWIPTAIVGLLAVSQTQYVAGNPWRRVHFPLMRLYARAAGAAHAAAERRQSSFDITEALGLLVQAHYPAWDQHQVSSFVEDAITQGQSFARRKEFTAAVQRQHANLSQEQLSQLVSESAEHFRSPDNGLIVRMVIAKVIEQEVGIAVAGEYLLACAKGEAK